MPMYNLIEYIDDCSGTSENLRQFGRDETYTNMNVCNANSSSFKYKSSLIGDVAVDGANGIKGKVKTAVPLKSLRTFWRSLELRLINCRVELIKNCLLSGGENIDNAAAVVNAGTAATF